MKRIILPSILLVALMAVTASAGAAPPAIITASNLQPVNNSNFTGATTIGLQGNCSIDDATLVSKVTNATAYLFYYENASFYGSVSNTSTVSNNTNFNISFSAPAQWLNFTWYLNCEHTMGLADDSANLTFNVNASASSATYFLTSVLSAPADASTQTVGESVALTGSCESNASLANATFWVYDANGAVYASLANSSAITNATAFSRSLTLPIQVTTFNWNLECADNESQTANASANYSFSIAGIGGSPSQPDYAPVCEPCASDGVCQACCDNDPDCESTPTPTTSAPVPSPTAVASPSPSPEPTVEPSPEPSVEPSPSTAPTVIPQVSSTQREEAEELIGSVEAELNELYANGGGSGGARMDEAMAKLQLAWASVQDEDYAAAEQYALEAQQLVDEEKELTAGSAGFDWTGIIAAALLLGLGYWAYKRYSKAH